MYNAEPNAGRFYAVNHNDDQALIAKGALIPTGHFSYEPGAIAGAVEIIPTASSSRPRWVNMVAVILVVALSLSTLKLLPSLPSLPSHMLAAVMEAKPPSIVVENSSTHEQTPLNYGVNVTFTEPDFFTDVRDAFIDNGSSFIEADLATMELRVFKDGVLSTQVPILSKGKKGSWWETPAGLYQVEFKKKKHFSTFGQVYMPWNLAFQGNFFIHGWPEYSDGTPVPEGYSGGCIRLSDADAETIYALAEESMPVLVHEINPNRDNFVYEPKIPELDTPHYLIADVESSTVLASSDLDNVASIASLTKLMTAVVAAEYINLDKSISVTQPTFVQSLIPRLGDRNKVSMYSLMQLLLIESSNEAAEVIAAQIGREQFINHMNEKAKSLGLAHTHFADPSGLSADNTSTVRDLLRLIQYIYDNRRFIVELTADQDLPTAYINGEFGKLINFNKVENLDNFIGGKVGETMAAGQTSITLHSLEVKGQKRILAIVLLGSDSRNADVRELLHYAEERFGY